MACGFLRLPSARGLDFIEQQFSCEIAVQTLRTLSLTLDSRPRRQMMQYDTGCYLVDVLSSCARGADKLLIDILFADTQRLHPLQQVALLFG